VATLVVLRKQFLDRVFTLSELASFADMLRQWYLIQAGNAGPRGEVRCDAAVYAYPKPDVPRIIQSLTTQLPQAVFDQSNPDELRINGSPRSATDQPDLSVWRIVLSDPLLAHVCVLLRLTIHGPMQSAGETAGDGTTTIVLCGAPASDGAMLVKTIWRLGRDESMQMIYRAAPWPREQRLLEAFEMYMERVAEQGVIASTETPALASFSSFERGQKDRLFRARHTERKVMWLTRQLAELPDQRGPAAFARRAGLPLVCGIGAIAVPFILFASPLFTAIFVIGGITLLWSAGRIIWHKFSRVRAYYNRMRQGLGTLYANPVRYQQVDLSDDTTPTLLKTSTEVEALGATHVGDLSIATANKVAGGARIYRIGNDTTLSFALLRQTENLHLFPARPLILANTRFTDGRRHFTANHPIYRKPSRPQVTGRCLSNEGGPAETLELHRKHVERLIAAGAKPIPLASTPQQAVERMQQDHEESREAWKTSPYSWGDALHDAFKVCRRVYLKD
jgi:hypothetical protein